MGYENWAAVGVVVVAGLMLAWEYLPRGGGGDAAGSRRAIESERVEVPASGVGEALDRLEALSLSVYPDLTEESRGRDRADNGRLLEKARGATSPLLPTTVCRVYVGGPLHAVVRMPNPNYARPARSGG